MSKRLKRRIHEVCGLTSLSKEERVRRARDILDTTAEKQFICNEIVGTSFKDVERALVDIINERKPPKDDDDYEQVEESSSPKRQKSNTAIHVIPLLDIKEVNRLISESNKPYTQREDSPPPAENSYSTYSLEEVAALVAGNYNPAMFRRRK